ncbi:MAG: hypothetical protein A2017_05090 [Lentisphaerae bacterium GWF2_44_16]|nr:MAG: hypothetical protein A2017_05090 [Lentisphaerae bacterium GWF2_44_16]
MEKRIVLISGVSSGIGKALASKFQKEGFTVAGVSRTAPSEDLKLDLWIQGDLTLPASRTEVLNSIRSKYGRLDVLINNAGKGIYEVWKNTSETDLRDIFELNFFTVVEMTRLFLPLLIEAKGTLINISSVAGKIHVPCMGPYCATKSALNSFTDTLRVELHSSGVRVLNIMPGRIDTGFSSRSLGSMTPPHTPGALLPEKIADKVFALFCSSRSELIYPSWCGLFIQLMKLFRGFYERQNIKRWGI